MPAEVPRKVALSFLAHPDDAEFLCAGTLSKLSQLGWEIHIATVSAGDLGSVSQNRWQISDRRTGEAQQAAALVGATYHCLGEHDCFVCTDKATLQKTYDFFRRIAPSMVFTHPRSDYMLDHEVVHQLARAGSFIFTAPNVSDFPLPPDATMPWLYYCDPIEGKDILGNWVKPTTYVDVSNCMETKFNMLACHESQRFWLKAHHGLDEYTRLMQEHSAKRGQEIGVQAAEAFVQHRGHAYPSEDLLAQLFAQQT